MNFKIRRMDPADIDEVYSVEVSAHASPWSKRILSDCIQVGYDCQVLEIHQGEKDEVVAFIISRINETKCHILNFSVAKSLQSKGLGRHLLDYLLRSLPKRIIVELEVRVSNEAAIRLYESVGFEKQALRKAYYQDSNGIEDAIILQKNN